LKLVRAINRIAYHVGYVYILYYENEYVQDGVEVSERLYKFGVSNTPEKRFKQINRALPGKLYKTGAFPVFTPYGFERAIRLKWGHLKQVPHGAGPGAGKHEFYNFGPIQITLLFLWCCLKGAILWAAPFALVFLALLATGQAEVIVYAAVVWLKN
jgi:hypothetical protein